MNALSAIAIHTDQITVCRSVQDSAQAVEAGAVAGTVPGLFGVVPMNDAAQMRADCRAIVADSALIAVNGRFRQAMPDDRARACFDLGRRIHVPAGQPVGVLPGDVETLFDEPAQSA